jgi:hypothetical protein
MIRARVNLCPVCPWPPQSLPGVYCWVEPVDGAVPADGVFAECVV